MIFLYFARGRPNHKRVYSKAYRNISNIFFADKKEERYGSGLIDRFAYDCDCLTWTTDGVYAGSIFIRRGKFSMTTHCGV